MANLSGRLGVLRCCVGFDVGAGCWFRWCPWYRRLGIGGLLDVARDVACDAVKDVDERVPLAPVKPKDP